MGYLSTKRQSDDTEKGPCGPFNLSTHPNLHLVGVVYYLNGISTKPIHELT